MGSTFLVIILLIALLIAIGLFSLEELIESLVEFIGPLLNFATSFS